MFSEFYFLLSFQNLGKQLLLPWAFEGGSLYISFVLKQVLTDIFLLTFHVEFSLRRRLDARIYSCQENGLYTEDASEKSKLFVRPLHLQVIQKIKSHFPNTLS